jgi:Ca2+-binding RTX toxin-like protein
VNKRHEDRVKDAARLWSLEELESRRFMSATSIEDGILVIRGTSGDDRINIHWELGGVCVSGSVEVLDPIMGLRGVRVDAGDGNDRVEVREDAALAPFELPVTLNGGLGDDSLQGGSGNDVLVGGAGDNLLDGRGGVNSLDGPTSPLAWAHYDHSSGTLTVHGTRKDDVIELIYRPWDSYLQYDISINGDTLESPDMVHVRRVVIEGGAGNDTIHVDAGELPATIYGGAGDDSIFGSSHADLLIGGTGHDMIFADRTTTPFDAYWQHYAVENGYDPEDYIERSDGVNRFNDGAGNDVIMGEGPDGYVPPAPEPAPAPAPAPSDATSSKTTGSKTADDASQQDAVSVGAPATAPKQAMVSSLFSINPVLASDKKLWDV